MNKQLTLIMGYQHAEDAVLLEMTEIGSLMIGHGESSILNSQDSNQLKIIKQHEQTKQKKKSVKFANADFEDNEQQTPNFRREDAYLSQYASKKCISQLCCNLFQDWESTHKSISRLSSIEPQNQEQQNDLIQMNERNYQEPNFKSRTSIGLIQLERYEEIEKILQQNIAQLEAKLQKCEYKICEITEQNIQLKQNLNKLKQKLLQSETKSKYYAMKFDALEVQEQEINALLQENQQYEKQIQKNKKDMAEITSLVDALGNELKSVQFTLMEKDSYLHFADEQIQKLRKQLQKNEQWLNQARQNQTQMYESAQQLEGRMKREIQEIMIENNNLRQAAKVKQKIDGDQFCHEGIQLGYDEAMQIKNIIEGNQRKHHQQIKMISLKYAEILEEKLKQIKQLNSKLSKNLERQEHETQCSNGLISDDKIYQDFQKVINQYDQELEERDLQISSLKKEIEELKNLYELSLIQMVQSYNSERYRSYKINQKLKKYCIELQKQVRFAYSFHEDDIEQHIDLVSIDQLMKSDAYHRNQMERSHEQLLEKSTICSYRMDTKKGQFLNNNLAK